MKAIVLHGIEDVRLEDVPESRIADNEVPKNLCRAVQAVEK